MVDREILSECLKTLINNEDTKTARDAIETMLRIHRNILNDEENTHYRKLRINNFNIAKKIWSLYPARQFMLLSGWIEMKNLQDPLIIFNSDERLLDVIEVLVDNRLIAPLEHEWVENTKLEGKSESQLREGELRRKAIAEKEKELAEFQKDKEYRENLAESIKRQIESDKLRRKQVFTGPVVGNKLVKGARIRTLNSSPSPNSRNQRM
ncbi:hypothetical protein JTE90_012123 [Oedothorax gibbosus]|uniref:PUB domain-containing protein n=1 Tax=Oedothorax gibbosus TaxID=931172 RepID=A0AAV6UVG0_9ARAC|nr:hypothetical protein JTE90_012123 [Oedothorax gibbosus]